MVNSAQEKTQQQELAPLATTLAKRLTPWFLKHQRDLAWRHTRDPYAIWVSEIMLQQTRVETVKDYYSRFLARFPDVGTLAAADEESVLEAWSGLGYYRRARLLHRGARYVLESHDGVVPGTADTLRKVPGIGRYTAGAITSIAFDRPAALVDGNVARVVSRLLAIREPERQGANHAIHWEVAQAVLERGSPRVLAQALMELGATVCTPQSPSCSSCPVRSACKAHAEGLSDSIPAKRKKIAQPVDDLWALAIYWRGQLLLERRPESGLLAGMWCLPLMDRESATNATKKKAAKKKAAKKKAAKKKAAKNRTPAKQKALQAAAKTWVTAARIKQTLGMRVRASAAPDVSSASVRHVFTHRVWNLQPARLEALARAKATLDRSRYAWIAPGERPAGGLPKVTQKLLTSLGHQ